MHSSRMHTVLCSGCLSCHAQPRHTRPPAMHAPVTYTPATHAPLPCMPPCHAHPSVMHAPPMNRITDRCKNITFPQLLLRTVTKSKCMITVFTSKQECIPVGCIPSTAVAISPATHITFKQLLLRTVTKSKCTITVYDHDSTYQRKYLNTW